MFRHIITNWKTTVVGAVEGTVTNAIGYGILGHFDWKFLALGFLQFLKGAVSKDANVTNSSNPMPEGEALR